MLLVNYVKYSRLKFLFGLFIGLKFEVLDHSYSGIVSCRAARIISELVGTYIVASWLRLDMELLRNEVCSSIPQNYKRYWPCLWIRQSVFQHKLDQIST